MNEQLSYKAINGIIETLNKGLDKAPDYVVDLVDRYQDYYLASTGFGVLCCFILMIVGIIIWIFGSKEEEDAPMIFGAILTIFAFICGACFVGNLIQGIYVPEIALIHSFSSCGK